VPDERVVEADAVGDLEVVRRIQRDALVALAERDRPEDLQVLLGGCQFLDARLVQDQVHERRGAAVHDRHFRAVQLDDDVVDAERRQRREQVLDGLDRHRFTGQAGRELDPPEMRDGRRNFQTAQIGTLEPDPVVDGRGLQREGDLVAGMKTDSGAGHGTTKSTLRLHGPHYWGLGSR
jgi:hypothetical protein